MNDIITRGLRKNVWVALTKHGGIILNSVGSTKKEVSDKMKKEGKSGWAPHKATIIISE